MIDHKQVEKFLSMLYPQDIPSGHLLIWTNPGKMSRWTTSTKHVRGLIQESAGTNVYLGCGLSPEDFGPRKRCPKSRIIGVPGFWADIDVKGDGHKSNKNYVDSKEIGIDLLKEYSNPPTLILDSGNGLQAWWLFDQPWIFESHKRAVEAQRLSTGFGTTLSKYFTESGYDIDSVFDLSRRLRIPGTENVKAEPKPVRLIEDDGPRYRDPFQLGGAILDLPVVDEIQPSPQSENRRIETSHSGAPNSERMKILFAIDPTIQDTWIGSSVRLRDTSDSGRDMSIATKAALAKWPPDEIEKLLRSGRTVRGAKQKPQSYFDLTVQKAFDFADKPAIAFAATKIGIVDPNISKQERLAEISNILGLNPPIQQLTKTVGDPATYRLYVNNQSVSLGDGSGILSQAKFRQKLFDVTGIAIPNFKRDKWLAISTSLWASLVEVDLEDEATELTQIQAWVDDYLAQVEVLDFEDYADSILGRMPFRRDGQTFFSIEGSGGIVSWLWLEHGVRYATRTIGRLLTEVGYQSERIRVPETGQRRVWSKDVTEH